MTRVDLTIARPGIPPVDTREELIFLLTRAAEIEHTVACMYLYAAHSLKSDVSEGGMTPAQAETVRNWKRLVSHVAVEEMLHLAQVTNLLTAIGGAPHFRRPNFPLEPNDSPLRVRLALEPFSQSLIERMVCVEMPEAGTILTPEEDAFFGAMRDRVVERGDAPAQIVPEDDIRTLEPFDLGYLTQGEFYHKIISGFQTIPEKELFIGPQAAQARGEHLDFGGELVKVVDRKSAIAAINMMVEQGEAPTEDHPDAHFRIFDRVRLEYAEAVAEAEAAGISFEPVRPVVSNPMTRYYEGTHGGTLITDPVTHHVADLFNVAYDTMLLLLLRYFAHGEETEEELHKLAHGSLLLMTTVLRPLGEALVRMPAGPGPDPLCAGPGFGYNREVHLLPHKHSAWVFFGERMHQLATSATKLDARESANLPPEVAEAVAGLERLAEDFAVRRPDQTRWREEAEFRALEADRAVEISPVHNGPFIATNVTHMTNSRGKQIECHAEMALCRCGGSRTKPFCDGTHSAIGFNDAKDPDRTPDGVADYVGSEITIHFNKLQCSAAERCARGLPDVFTHGADPWIRPDNASAFEIMNVIRKCPSGALRYTYKQHTGPKREHHMPSIRVGRNGPYEVRGIRLKTDEWCAGAADGHYVLCRCGASKNKPFCDGSHWKVRFIDKDN
jgi:CDGSH-type Zn-finger protein